jgi:hypothetical protein
VQFVTHYRHSTGTLRIRITTVALPLIDASTAMGAARLKAGFDAETAAVVVARMAVYKGDTEFAVDTIRWVDRTLIKLVRRRRPASIVMNTKLHIVCVLTRDDGVSCARDTDGQVWRLPKG